MRNGRKNNNMKKCNAIRCNECKAPFGIFKWKYECEECHNFFCYYCLKTVGVKNICTRCYLYNCSRCKQKFTNKFLIVENSFKMCQECYDFYLPYKTHWINGTKNEYIRGYKIVKEIGYIKIGSDKQCSSISELESILGTKCAINGANSFVKFFWKKNVTTTKSSELEGFGNKGNPYYSTKYTRNEYFTGEAMAVLVQKN